VLKYEVFIDFLGWLARHALNRRALRSSNGLVQHDFMYAGESHNRRI